MLLISLNSSLIYLLGSIDETLASGDDEVSKKSLKISPKSPRNPLNVANQVFIGANFGPNHGFYRGYVWSWL